LRWNGAFRPPYNGHGTIWIADAHQYNGKREVEQLEKQIEKLTAGLQKVNDRMEAIEPAAKMVNNN